MDQAGTISVEVAAHSVVVVVLVGSVEVVLVEVAPVVAGNPHQYSY